MKRGRESAGNLIFFPFSAEYDRGENWEMACWRKFNFLLLPPPLTSGAASHAPHLSKRGFFTGREGTGGIGDRGRALLSLIPRGNHSFPPNHQKMAKEPFSCRRGCPPHLAQKEDAAAAASTRRKKRPHFPVLFVGVSPPQLRRSVPRWRFQLRVFVGSVYQYAHYFFPGGGRLLIVSPCGGGG